MNTATADKARRVAFTLSCLQEGVRRARQEAAERKRAARNAGLEANCQAKWRD